jgi:hypothetical protein
VGDVHQPLHATARFRHNDADGDNGGNDVHLQCPLTLGCASNLHSEWDGLLGNTHDLAQVTTLGLDLDGQPVPPGADVTDPDAWTTESFDIAKTDVYLDRNGHTLGDPDATLDAAYVSNAEAVAKARVILAAHRLAALINAALGSS